MSKDYANSEQKHHKPIAGWIWMLSGLIIGLFVALLVYINDNTSNEPKLTKSVNKLFQARGTKEKDARAVKKEPSEGIGKTLNKLKFDFYTILPELEVAIPEQELLNTFKNEKSDKPKQSIILQAGSFRKFAEADKLKAMLALQGIEANIQKVELNNGDTWHRVRVGPLTTRKSLNSTRQRLRDLGIASIMIKNKS